MKKFIPGFAEYMTSGNLTGKGGEIIGICGLMRTSTSFTGGVIAEFIVIGLPFSIVV